MMQNQNNSRSKKFLKKWLKNTKNHWKTQNRTSNI